MSNRKPYSGTHRRLVLAFDVGTTYSGISYSILDPGQVPEIRGVTRFPAQENVGGDSKIPTVIFYDKDGQVCAIGAEATREGIEEQAEEEGWTKAEWFKLHLRPRAASSTHINDTIPPLPKGKIAVDILADFLRYLHRAAQTYIEETHANGIQLWNTIKDRTDIVLTHPNGWEGAQQSMMRQASVKAGLIPNSPDGQRMLSFVTEGEASLHFCIQSGLTSRDLKERIGVLVVDAGGGTIDISAYQQTSLDEKSFEETAAPQCHFQGSIFVTSNAKAYLEEFLKDSEFLEDVPNITKCFDKTTKKRFRHAQEPQYIKFGNIRDKDPKVNIRSGQLRLDGQVSDFFELCGYPKDKVMISSEVASFFKPSIECIVNAIEEQCGLSETKIGMVFLVGGFAASDWLFSNVRDQFLKRGIIVSRPDSHVNKAVADGAVSFHLDNVVRARVSKYTYGVDLDVHFDPTNSGHLARISTKYIHPLDDEAYIPDAFDIILRKNTKVLGVQEFKRHYIRTSNDSSDLASFTDEILCYRGKNADPRWMDQDAAMYSVLCYITPNTSSIPWTVRTSHAKKTKYYKMSYDIIISFGLTEMKAQVSWMENGIEKRGPAEIVFDPEELIQY